MNPLYQALICCFVKLVLSMRNCMSSLGSFLLAPTPIPGAVYRANPSSSSSSSSRLAYFESLDGAGVLPMYLVTRSNHWLVALHSHLHMHTRYTASEWVCEWVVVSVALIHRRRKMRSQPSLPRRTNFSVFVRKSSEMPLVRSTRGGMQTVSHCRTIDGETMISAARPYVRDGELVKIPSVEKVMRRILTSPYSPYVRPFRTQFSSQASV